ncbi:transglutaminase domain-containing protein [Lysinibacillus sp. NPDC048646]|uniref:transglutaminase domain-containing protein n=1 Tax=Lysinibacillus sp. NPDC048646 TaxID=3390574 RepID=UPI003D05BFF6
MRKYIYNVIIILFVLQMSHVQVFANYEQKTIATANTIETLQDQIQKEVKQFATEFDIRYTGDTSALKDELTELIKHAIKDPYYYANISSFRWKYDGYANNIVIEFQFTYHISQDEEDFVERTLTDIIAPMHGLSELKKLQAAHDFIVLTSEYSKETKGSQYSPYTLLTENKGVCQAYALVLFRMLEMLGFEVQYVTGEVGDQLHAWVLVKLEKAWYHIDVTWDDPLPDRQGEVRYNYFLLSDRQLAQDHIWDYASYPAATSEDYTVLQQDSKVEVMTIPVAYSSLNNDRGLSILGQNKLYTMQLEEQPSHLEKRYTHSDKPIQMVPYDMNKQIIFERTLAYLPAIPTLEEVEVAHLVLTSIHRSEKSMPQEKLVIIKEVAHLAFGAPPFSRAC